VLDNLRGGVLTPDIYDPMLNTSSRPHFQVLRPAFNEIAI
jgi:hypothetical protein